MLSIINKINHLHIKYKIVLNRRILYRSTHYSNPNPNLFTIR